MLLIRSVVRIRNELSLASVSAVCDMLLKLNFLIIFVTFRLKARSIVGCLCHPTMNPNCEILEMFWWFIPIQLFRQSFSINSVFGQVPHDFLCPKSVFMFTRWLRQTQQWIILLLVCIFSCFSESFNSRCKWCIEPQYRWHVSWSGAAGIWYNSRRLLSSG